MRLDNEVKTYLAGVFICAVVVVSILVFCHGVS